MDFLFYVSGKILRIFPGDSISHNKMLDAQNEVSGGVQMARAIYFSTFLLGVMEYCRWCSNRSGCH